MSPRNESISQIAVSPEECVILFGIPTDYAGFRRDLSSSNKDLIPNSGLVWPQYRSEVVAPVERLIAAAEKLNVRVQRDVELQDITNACDGRHLVVILVSHWTDDCVELADGLHPFKDVVVSVPDDFEGFVDLIICVPDSLGIALRDLKPNCIIRFARGTYIIPSLWFGILQAVITNLGEAPRPYMDAFNDLIARFSQPED